MTSTQRIDNRLADTALMVAVCRAIAAARGTHGLSDPYSKVFVDASGVPYWTAFLESGESLLSQKTDFALKARAMLGHVVARTRFIDSLVDRFVEDGRTRQLVILGAGFDTRSLRLQSLKTVDVYEVDIDDVTTFKSAVLQTDELAGTHTPTLVSANLANDWIPQLRHAGWTPDTPTMWLAEGLLGYLHASEQSELLQSIAEHSPMGSAAMFEYATTISGDPSPKSSSVEEFARDNEQSLPDLTSLIHVEHRIPPDVLLRDHGWRSDIDEGESIYRTWFDESDPLVTETALSAQFATKFITSTRNEGGFHA